MPRFPDPRAEPEARVAKWLALSRLLLGEARDDGGVLIHYRCVTQEHLDAANEFSGRVTAHERRWAYCNDPSAASDHQWEATGGVSVELLRIEQRRLLEVLSARRHQVAEARAALEPKAETDDDTAIVRAG